MRNSFLKSDGQLRALADEHERLRVMSPEGQRVATGGQDGNVKYYSDASGFFVCASSGIEFIELELNILSRAMPKTKITYF